MRAALPCLDGSNASPEFKITRFIAEEMEMIDGAKIANYIFHRYRYDVFPKRGILDDYPPCVQIEPAAHCNYKCVFCFQTNDFFKKRENTGFMTLDMYRRIIDDLEGNVEFISLASRGEPLLCKDICAMLKHSAGKFHNLKINTNASLLTEKHAHAILSDGARTLVFSADAADSEMYAKLRVNGDLGRVIKNIEMFKNIREKHYPNAKIITRVSGVKANDAQEMKRMVSFWSGLADQISFVKYNPWENIYDSEPNKINEPCSDMYRRMFIWRDGKANPCDTDFKSLLSPGVFGEMSVSQLWRSPKYSALRAAHKSGGRQSSEPCKRCPVL